MDEENPLNYISNKAGSKLNKSGRPKNDKLIKFSPQPQSQISQMLKKLKNDVDIIHQVTECKDSNTIPDTEAINCIHEDNEESDINIDPAAHKTHGGGAPNTNKSILFPCDYPKCNYVTKLSSNLIKHKRTHTMEKPYLCDLCSFRSNFVNSLKVHKRTHTNERPYKCKHCNYCCNSSSNLKKHCKHRHWDVVGNMPLHEQA